MTALLVAFAFACGLGGGVALTKVKRRGPVNIVDGMLMPHPSDERWKTLVSSQNGCAHPCYVIGELVICNETNQLRIGGKVIGKSARYREAVQREQIERKALAAALGDT